MTISKRHLQEIKDIDEKDINYTDIPELDVTFWENAELRMPEPKEGVYIRLDSDVLDWFKSHGKGYQTRINTVLRSYIKRTNTNHIKDEGPYFIHRNL